MPSFGTPQTSPKMAGNSRPEILPGRIVPHKMNLTLIEPAFIQYQPGEYLSTILLQFEFKQNTFLPPKPRKAAIQRHRLRFILPLRIPSLENAPTPSEV